MLYDYAWQKSLEAATALAGAGTLEERLRSAADSLAQFPCSTLPSEAQAQALVTQRAFTLWPHPHPDGAAAGLLAALPDARKRELARKVVALYGTVCKLTGTESVPLAASAVELVELRGDDRWEFLYWGTSTQSPPAEQATYTAYARHYLPDFPAEVLLEWLGRHGYEQMRRWAHLDLASLRFERADWRRDQVGALKAMRGSEGYLRVGGGSQGASALERPSDWVGQQVAAAGTWPHPIVVFESVAEHEGPEGKVPQGFVLVEGHRRVAALLNAQVARLKPHHVVWVARALKTGDHQRPA